MKVLIRYSLLYSISAVTGPPLGATVPTQDIPSGSLFDETHTDGHNQGDKVHNQDLDLQNRVLGPYPQTVAVTLWGLDTIKTKGESVAILLALVGAEPVREVRTLQLEWGKGVRGEGCVEDESCVF